jgi:hypothetical protein
MIDPGSLRYPVRILTPGAGDDAGHWVPLRRARADAEASSRRTLFSAVGLSAHTVLFTLRLQSLSPGDMIEWFGQWYYVTDVTRKERLYLTAIGAAVTPVSCTAETEGGSVSFQAAVTEKYVGHGMGDTHAESSVTYVLVTPKAAALSPGDRVTLADGPVPGVYPVTGCHLLDGYKNEYEIERKADV